MRLLVVGCGAIVSRFYRPALSKLVEQFKTIHFVDPVTASAKRMALEFPNATYSSSLRETSRDYDISIIAVPVEHHYDLAIDLVRNGKTVLVEKPLCNSYDEANKLVLAADRSGSCLAVNQTRRLFWGSTEIKKMLDQEALGAVRRIDYRYGEFFDWPSASQPVFVREGRKKGVLLDIGTHVFDLLGWWVPGEWRITSYSDDAIGGSEATVKFEGAINDVVINVELSWLSTLENTFRIDCERGTICGKHFEPDRFSIIRERGPRRIRRCVAPRAEVSSPAVQLLKNVIRVTNGQDEIIASGQDVLKTAALIDSCYERRRRMQMPWFVFHSSGA